MRTLDDILELVNSDLKMELIQQELDRYSKKQKTIDDSKKAINEVENRTLRHMQRLIDEYYKNKSDKMMFLYETIDSNKVYFNVIQDETKTEDELKTIIENEKGKIIKKFNIKENIIYVDDVPIRKIKNLGKTYRLIEVKK